MSKCPQCEGQGCRECGPGWPVAESDADGLPPALPDPDAFSRLAKQHRRLRLWLATTEAYFRTHRMPRQARIARQLLDSTEDFSHV